MKFTPFFVGLFLLLFITSCSKNRFEIDTKQVDLNLKFERFDNDFMALDTSRINQQALVLQKKYGDFFNYYFNQVFRFGSPDSSAFETNVKALFQDSMYAEVYKECQLVFKDISGIENETNEAFKYIKYYFPDKKIPRLAMHISGFNQSIVITNTFLSVSIDNYLGADYAPYKSIAYDYQLQNMTKEKVAPDIVLGYLMSEFPFENNTQLLDGILSRGKVLYLQSICMPQRTEAELMGYTSEQMDWCVKNEKNMWTYLVENKHVYNSSQLVCAKYLNPSPFTSYFTNDSPGQAAIWVGLQIIKSYMENNTSITLPELMKQTDYQLILEESNYKP